MPIADRIRECLANAKLTARDLAAISNVHYTTIYLIEKRGESANPLPTVAQSIENALDKIESLIQLGDLPFESGLSQADRLNRLVALINNG